MKSSKKKIEIVAPVKALNEAWTEIEKAAASLIIDKEATVLDETFWDDNSSHSDMEGSLNSGGILLLSSTSSTSSPSISIDGDDAVVGDSVDL